MSRPRILVHDEAGTLPRLVEDLTSGFAPPPEIVPSDHPDTLAQRLTSQRFDVLVAGPGLDGRAGWERLRIIREERPAMSIVLALPDPDSAPVADVVRAGAVDLLRLPLEDRTAAEGSLARALLLAGRVAPGGPPEVDDEPVPDPGRVITVASASGGSGKTFLATNIAWFLRHRRDRRVCIVDLDLQFGEVTSSLRLRPETSIIDLLRLVGDDDGALADHLLDHCTMGESGIHVLPAPLDPTLAQVVQPDDVVRVVEATRQAFDVVVIDTPPALTDAVVAAFARSDELLVVATLDVPSIRNLHVFLGTLERLGVDGSHVRLLLNKAERGSGIEPDQVAEMFDRPFEVALPYAREVQRSVNVGRTVLDAHPDAEVSRLLGSALDRLLPSDRPEVDAREARPPRRRRGLLRMREAV